MTSLTLCEFPKTYSRMRIWGFPLHDAKNQRINQQKASRTPKSKKKLKKWAPSPPEPQIHRNHTLARDWCKKIEKMSATEGNKHILGAQKLGKNSIESFGMQFLKHPSSENTFLKQAEKKTLLARTRGRNRAVPMEKMSATEGNKRFFASQKSGKNSIKTVGVRFLKHLSNETLSFWVR